MSRTRRYTPLLVIVALVLPALSPASQVDAVATAFVRRWAQDDAAIASGQEQRSWLWGPLVLRSGSEAYAQSPEGRREVWYLDKARMEISHPDANPDDDWFVTSGLLVRELISGQMQLGDDAYEQWQPADIPVAGDLEAPPDQTITYARLRPFASIEGQGRRRPRPAEAGPLIAVISPAGKVAEDTRFASYKVRAGGYDDVLGHNIADVFLAAMPAEQLLYIAGRPLTEPYWAQVPVAHERRDVLVQAFERRVLTYTPSNPSDWRVEWGNVGRQYAQWRYGQPEDETTFDPYASIDVPAAVRDLKEIAPAAVNIAQQRQGNAGVAVYQLATGAFYSFGGTQPFPMYSTVKVPIMLAVLDQTLQQKRNVSADEHSLITSMIQNSDNGATSVLLAGLGGGLGLERYLRRIGITGTHINGDAWGASTTTPQDMARLMAKLGNCTILIPRLCQYALERMRSVVPSQRWGISAGAPADASIAIKNGWYPQGNGWGINSVGLVASAGKSYAIAVYTNPDPSMDYGIQTIEQIAVQVYPAVP